MDQNMTLEIQRHLGVDARMYRGVTLCTTSLHLMPLSVLPPFTSWFCGCPHNKILLFSTDFEVHLSEVEFLVFVGISLYEFHIRTQCPKVIYGLSYC